MKPNNSEKYSVKIKPEENLRGKYNLLLLLLSITYNLFLMKTEHAMEYKT